MDKPVCAVIGGSGFLGGELCEQLRQAFRVVPTAMKDRGDGRFRVVDIREESALRAFLAETKPDCVALLAAYREPDFCEENPEEARRLNTRPAEIMSACLPAGIPLLFISTDYVFDGDHPPYQVDSVRNPVSVYGQTKRDAEDFVMARRGGIVLRVPLLMGWTDHPDRSGFFSHLMNDLRKTDRLELDNILKRYPVWTRDVGAAVQQLFLDGRSGAFHYSTTRPMTRYTAALEMAELLHWPADHIVPSDKIVQRKAARPVDARLAMDKWESLGYSMPQDFRDVVHQFMRHFPVTR